MRYELHRPTTERFDRFNNFNYSVANPLGPLVGLPLRGGLVFPGSSDRYSWEPLYDNFAPRLGISIKLSEKLVLRTGYGIFYPIVTGTGDLTGFSSTTPWTFSQVATASIPRICSATPIPTD